MRWLISFLLAACAVSARMPAAEVAVVCPAGLREALRPWSEYRTRQGHTLRFVDAHDTPAKIQAAIRKLASKTPLAAVVLVGDAVPNVAPRRPPLGVPVAIGLDNGFNDPNVAARREWCVPTDVVPARIIRQLGPDRDIATDNGYGDFDGDGVPDAAVGRLTCDSPAELAILVRKIIAYEREDLHGPWCRQINLVAGVGGFGRLADAAIEACAKHFITSGVPAAYATTLTHASWQSPYCPAPNTFHQCTVDRLSEGSLFFVYIGHGERRYLDHLHVPGRRSFPILHSDDVAKIRCRNGPPIAVFLACYTGAFDQSRDCLAEELLRHDNGPVAVLAGSRMTMPYAMGVMGLGMMRQTFVHRRETIGEILLHSKRRLVDGRRDDPESKTLDWLAGTLGLHSDLAAERAEHVLLFNLLGDPLLRVPHAREVTLQAPAAAAAGEAIEIVGESPLAGRCTVELVVRRDRLTFSPKPRTKFELTEVAQREFTETYRHANEPCLQKRSLDVSAGRFSSTLQIPAAAIGPCHIRVLIESPRGLAMGAADIVVRPSSVKDAAR